jgi:hypothetical protein
LKSAFSCYGFQAECYTCSDKGKVIIEWFDRIHFLPQIEVPENDIIQKLVQLEITFVQQAPLAFSMWVAILMKIAPVSFLLSLHKMQMVCEKHPEDVYIEYLA